MMKEVKIGDKIIGENHPCYTVAEIGSTLCIRLSNKTRKCNSN